MGEADILASILAENNKSNLLDLNLIETVDLGRLVTAILVDAPDLHSYKSSIGFDPVQLTFVRKLVSNEILDRRLRFIKRDYFQATSFLSFYMQYITADNSMVDEIVRRGGELERIDPFLDPDIGLLIRLCSLDYMSSYRNLSPNDRRRNNFNRWGDDSFTAYHAFRQFDPVINSAANLVLAQYSLQESLQLIPTVPRIRDLGALLFVDVGLSWYRSQVPEVESNVANNYVLSNFSSSGPLKAAHSVMEVIAEQAVTSPIQDYIDHMQPTRYTE